MRQYRRQYIPCANRHLITAVRSSFVPVSFSIICSFIIRVVVIVFRFLFFFLFSLLCIALHANCLKNKCLLFCVICFCCVWWLFVFVCLSLFRFIVFLLLLFLSLLHFLFYITFNPAATWATNRGSLPQNELFACGSVHRRCICCMCALWIREWRTTFVSNSSLITAIWLATAINSCIFTVFCCCCCCSFHYCTFLSSMFLFHIILLRVRHLFIMLRFYSCSLKIYHRSTK